jgi:hypothetical protein
MNTILAKAFADVEPARRDEIELRCTLQKVEASSANVYKSNPEVMNSIN